MFVRLFVSVININLILNSNHRGRFVSLRPFFNPGFATMIYLRTAKMSSIPTLCKVHRTPLKHDSKLQMIKIVGAHNNLSNTWCEKIDLIKQNDCILLYSKQLEVKGRSRASHLAYRCCIALLISEHTVQWSTLD